MSVSTSDDTVTLSVGGQDVIGWTEVRITRRAEGLPNDFEVGLTASNPDGTTIAAYAGQPCTLAVGGTTLITGYIDRDTNAGDARQHRLGIIGRGRCADLVDCSAEWKGGQISGATALQVCSKLAAPYGIEVVQAPGLTVGPPIPQFNLNYGETAQEIIDRVCTYAGFLYYEDEEGDLVLSSIGQVQAASGFVYGQNVQAYSVQNAMDGRFSDYACAMLSMDSLESLNDAAAQFYFTAKDQNVARHRLIYLITEQLVGGDDLCMKRALWEAARRAGRGCVARVTADSWRDQAGALWTPNTLAPVTLPGLRLPAASNLVISEVTLVESEERGKVADVTLMPAAAFALQPVVIQPTLAGYDSSGGA